MLEAAGLTVVEETVYRLLVGAVTASAHELAQQSELPHDTLEAVLAALTGKGLASPTDHVPPQYSAVPRTWHCCPGCNDVPTNSTRPAARSPICSTCTAAPGVARTPAS